MPPQKRPEDMTEEEKNYLYFKVHDLDGNDKLDGLEIFYSATHHSESHEAIESHEGDDHNLFESNDHEEAAAHKGLNHIIGKCHSLECLRITYILFQRVATDVLDNFLEVADVNQDGFLNFAEYAAAVKLGNAMANAEADLNNL